MCCCKLRDKCAEAYSGALLFLPALFLHSFPKQIGRSEGQPLRDEKFRPQPYSKELFRCHAVVFHKAHSGKGRCAEDAQPADRFRTQHIPQTEINTDGNTAGQHRKNELPQRQPEEDILLVVPYLPVDFDLHCRHPLSGAFFTGRLGWMAVGLSPLSGRRKSIRAAA